MDTNSTPAPLDDEATDAEGHGVKAGHRVEDAETEGHGMHRGMKIGEAEDDDTEGHVGGRHVK